jgi:hypothetical protein
LPINKPAQTITLVELTRGIIGFKNKPDLVFLMGIKAQDSRGKSGE